MKNVGNIDRIVRTVVGIALLWFALYREDTFILSVLLAVAGVTMLLSAITGFCFILRALGISTCNGRK